jgi:hypothetical protein
MSSAGIKQNHNDMGYYIPVADLTGQVYGYSGNASGNTGTLAGTFSTATWAYYGAKQSLSSIRSAGAGILRDLGKTVVSSNRTFRKVQLVFASTTASTFGVGGRSDFANETYFTGYIELGFDGNGAPAPVAHFGR